MKFATYFFLRITRQTQSQTWKFHRVLMCIFPVKVPLKTGLALAQGKKKKTLEKKKESICK